MYFLVLLPWAPEVGPQKVPNTNTELSFCSWDHWPSSLSFFICSIMSPVRNNVGRGLNIALVNGE